LLQNIELSDTTAIKNKTSSNNYRYFTNFEKKHSNLEMHVHQTEFFSAKRVRILQKIVICENFVENIA